MQRSFIRFMPIILATAFLLCALASHAGEATPGIDPNLAPDDDAFMSRHAAALLCEIAQTLKTVPPSAPEPRERTLALRLLDAVLHDPHAPNRPAVQSFYHDQMANASTSIESARVTDGAIIWKLYNHGFIVRTATVTLAFDVHPGPAGFRTTLSDGSRGMTPCPKFPTDDVIMKRIIDQCDILFISHVHADHVAPAVIERFLDQGKPVVAPDNVLLNSPLHDRITHLKREAHTLQELPIQKGQRILRLVVYPGQQYQDGGVPNNVVLVYSPEGMTFVHNGDQINDPYPAYQEDYAWIDQVHEHHRVDVYMTNCWCNDIFRDVRGFDPKVVIPGHENELSHPLWDRVPFWGDSEYLLLTYPELKASTYPVVVMTWGESYHYLPQTPTSPIPATP